MIAWVGAIIKVDSGFFAQCNVASSEPYTNGRFAWKICFKPTVYHLMVWIQENLMVIFLWFDLLDLSHYSLIGIWYDMSVGLNIFYFISQEKGLCRAKVSVQQSCIIVKKESVCAVCWTVISTSSSLLKRENITSDHTSAFLFIENNINITRISIQLKEQYWSFLVFVLYLFTEWSVCYLQGNPPPPVGWSMTTPSTLIASLWSLGIKSMLSVWRPPHLSYLAVIQCLI